MTDSDKYPKLKRERRSAEPQIEPAGEDDGQTRRASSPALRRVSRPHHGRPGEHRPRLHRCDAGLHEGPGSEGGSTARRPALRARPPPTRRPPSAARSRADGRCEAATSPRAERTRDTCRRPPLGRHGARLLSQSTLLNRQRPHCLNKGSPTPGPCASTSTSPVACWEPGRTGGEQRASESPPVSAAAPQPQRHGLSPASDQRALDSRRSPGPRRQKGWGPLI